MRGVLSVIIPASNEAGYIGPCLESLFASGPQKAEAVVVANGCRDNTAAIARSYAARAEAAGWNLTVLDLPQGGKPGALNAGDKAARGRMRAYVDADVRVSPQLIPQIIAALDRDLPTYASGRPLISRGHSWVTRAYAGFWSRLPFAQSPAPGFGFFAVNAAGRARWGAFPGIISDDTFVRLQFSPHERIECPATYTWPMIEGFSALVRVRRRQDAGVAEIAQLYPGILAREAKPRLGALGLARLAAGDPLGFATYAAVSLAVRLGRNRGWARGR